MMKFEYRDSRMLRMREYFASGGDPMWFQSHVKSLANQHLERLNYSTLGRMRLPIPGGRHYVMPAAVGRAAGLAIQVGRGEIFIDPQRGTAWVNDQDWLGMEEGKSGIAGILGGADNDDIDGSQARGRPGRPGAVSRDPRGQRALEDAGRRVPGNAAVY